jgi:general secretion pathway protein D
MTLFPFKVLAAATMLLLAVAPATRAQNPRPGRISPALAATGNATINRKLAGIIIPRLEFHATTLEDAVEFLRQESRRLDTDPDANARGVNILLELPPPEAAAQTSPAPSAATRITLTLNRIPLLEALQYIGLQAGLKLRVEPYAVSLVPLTENTEAMVTAVFRVPPGLIGHTTTGAGGASDLDQPASAVP